MKPDANLPLTLTPCDTIGELLREDAAAPVPGAVWYTANALGQGLLYRLPIGALAQARYLTADLLVDGNHMVVFVLELKEGEDGRTFHLVFSALNQCQARIRMPLEAVNQNRWRYDREGAWLKPMCAGERVDPARVDRMSLLVLRKSDEPARFCLTDLAATAAEPPRLTDPILPKGPLLDEFGQSTLHDWPQKTRSEEELVSRLRSQLARAAQAAFPASFSRWGGCADARVEATGFFRTHHDGTRWWLVDPDGCLFWSSGLDCVAPAIDAACHGIESALTWIPEADGPYAEAHWSRAGGRSVDYLKANLIRAFGSPSWYDSWARIALGELKNLGFNTVANWSDWQAAREAGFPYVRPLHLGQGRAAAIYRDFPDVFDPAFEEDAAEFAAQLADTADDPAFLGYFLMNEPTWGFAGETPAAGMLFATPTCHTRRALADFLAQRHGTEAALSAEWNMDVRLSQIAEGEWREQLTRPAEEDLAAFSVTMVARLFQTVSRACRRVDPHHLNLGARYYTAPPAWALEGMRSFDVFSVNCYHPRLLPGFADISRVLQMPVLVGEWHFGALDVGLPASGLVRVRDQQARGRAFRVYLEDAAAKPWCVGVHYFTLYDQSALGRFDGENYNIGFLDVCNRPYEPLAEAARRSNERIYAVARGEVEPYDCEPEYLPRLFL